jgi:putative glycosyltransferase (TIGR04348 family)
MLIRIVSTTPATSKKGNQVTATRWSQLLEELGHDVVVESAWSGAPCDLLIALHARRSFSSVARFRAAHPRAPLVLALTGTDLYQDLPHHPDARRALELCNRSIVLQPLAIHEIPERYRAKASVILQSASPPPDIPPPREDIFEIAVVGHLRAVKDPFRAAEAVRRLPSLSRIRISHYGAALEAGLAERAEQEMRSNPRYRWMGEVSRDEAMRGMGRSRLVAVTSLSEGGPNVISEALACGVPVLSSRIAGSLGLLGEDYPGTFEVGDTAGLAALMLRAEQDSLFRAGLRARCAALEPRIRPAAERQALGHLLADLAPRQHR